jgi:hypothetical protein
MLQNYSANAMCFACEIMYDACTMTGIANNWIQVHACAAAIFHLLLQYKM